MAPKRILILSNPRSGSTLLANYLKSHPDIYISHELLNDDEDIPTEIHPIDYIEQHLQNLAEEYPTKSIFGFKTFPEQIYKRGLTFNQLILSLGISHVIVLWRNNSLETFVSKLIAESTGNWYSLEEPTEITKVELNLNEYDEYKKKLIHEWTIIGQQWPIHIPPVYIEYESFINNKVTQCNFILEQLSCNQIGDQLKAYCKRQNPASLQEKIINWAEIQKNCCLNNIMDFTLNIQNCLEPLLEANLKIPKELLHLVPDREPPCPVNGWKYRVAEPYISSKIKQNVYEAIESGFVSSAGCWVNKLSSKLKSFYECPVAQPCSNGFTAITLALQTIGIGPKDEVIIPSLTMIAVANAVSYCNGKVIFADSSKSNYNPGWDEIKSVATERTKAVIVTHTYGVPTPNIELIAQKCKEHNWWLIEDISECVGIRVPIKKLVDDNKEEEEEEEGRLLGTFGDFACASLYANKIIHAGDGGFVIAKNITFGEKLKSLTNHGFTPSYHFVHFDIAMNCKINGIGAAMAIGCLDELSFVMKHRSQLATKYRQLLTNKTNIPLKLMPNCGWNDTPWVFGVECSTKNERTKLRAFLAKYGGIESRDYFFPLHLQPAYNSISFENCTKRLVNAEKFGSTGFYLPTFTNLQDEDIVFICSIIEKFYEMEGCKSNRNNNCNNTCLTLDLPQPPSHLKNSTQSLFFEPNTFNIQVKHFNSSTNSFQIDENYGILHKHGHPFKKAIKLVLELEEALVLESWSKQQCLLVEIEEFIQQIENNQMKQKFIQQFEIFIKYFKSQSNYDDLSYKLGPWINEDLNHPIYSASFDIPTTSDEETIQMLMWLVKEKQMKTIWEIGSWFGHTTARLSAAAAAASTSSESTEDIKVYACDVFQWQTWMQRYLTKKDYKIQNLKKRSGSFLPEFKSYTEKFSHIIQAVEWPYTIKELPNVLIESKTPDLIFIDITQEEEELEFVWELILPKLKSNQTIIVFNGFVGKSLPFFTRHANSLKPIAKPKTISKAFLYIDQNEVGTEQEEEDQEKQLITPVVPLERRLKFHSSPLWTHHHQNAFGYSIELLKNNLHSPTSSTLFIPAVEETLCDNPELLIENSWVGIIHSVEKHSEFFYTPDLTRLCSNEFRTAMLNCKGLFTLTRFQADYLTKNLNKILDRNIPIQNIIYPMITTSAALLEIGIGTSSCTVIDNWKNGNQIKLLLVGSFARDFNIFYNCKIPSNIRKTILIGDETIQQEIEQRKDLPEAKFIDFLPRLDEKEYEETLKESIICLPLKYEGAANTTILECINRNVPILIPALSSCLEYIGQDYPLVYKQEEENRDFTKILTLENVESAINYLKNMDKIKFNPEYLVESVKNSSVLLAVSPSKESSSLVPVPASLTNLPINTEFDVTISICSYKRTHHLKTILHSLWYNQDFTGSIQIIIWNNNIERSDVVHQICKEYLTSSVNPGIGKKLKRSLEIIDSTTNYYCSIRFALASIMKSQVLLICDDDINPNSTFVSYFMSAHVKYPTNVLCTRGHVFLPHQLSDLKNPTDVWLNYEYLRFKSDEMPEQFIHFVHADTCLIPREALREVCSVELPDNSFHLVDDYWMSFILNCRFGRNLRKLTTAGLKELPFSRTDDSDTSGLALHTRPEVKDAKLRLYLYHKLQNWPPEAAEIDVTTSNELSPLRIEQLRKEKIEFWNKQFVGYNVSSKLSTLEIEKLVSLGVKCVRIGAVGVTGNDFKGHPQEFEQLNDNPEKQVTILRETIQLLAKYDISVVITTTIRFATPLNWKLLAKGLRHLKNVVGYDLINEPFLKSELPLHRKELENIQPNRFPAELQTYIELIQAVRDFDEITPIIIEPTFWGHIDALRLLPIETLLRYDSNLIVSFHFYEPRLITQRTQNKGRYQFPGLVPIFDNIKYSESINWNADEIHSQLSKAIEWSKVHNGIKIFIGEFGICRDIKGADKYIQAILDSCNQLKMSSFVYSFRDKYWDAMNYEFGTDATNYFLQEENNKLMETIRNAGQLNSPQPFDKVV